MKSSSRRASAPGPSSTSIQSTMRLTMGRSIALVSSVRPVTGSLRLQLVGRRPHGRRDISDVVTGPLGDRFADGDHDVLR